jgi:hypothetical protein
VTQTVKGGVLVDIGARAFLPASLADRYRVADLQSLVGSDITARIIEFEPSTNTIVISRKVILEAEHAQRAKELQDTLAAGQERLATVQSVKSSGIVVDFGGMTAWIPSSELGIQEKSKVGSSFTIGEQLTVTVCDVAGGKIVASLRRGQDEALLDKADAASLVGLPRDPDVGTLGVIDGALSIDLGDLEIDQIIPLLQRTIDEVRVLAAKELNVTASSAQRRYIRQGLMNRDLASVDAKRCRQTANGFLLIIQPPHTEGNTCLA